MFRDLATLFEHPDPRRIDVRQSMRDPFETLHVRRFEDKCAVSVTVLLDVSASMGFLGTSRKMDLARAIVATLASSARRTGDTFALFGCDSAIVPELTFRPPARAPANRSFSTALRPSHRALQAPQAWSRQPNHFPRAAVSSF